MTGQTSSEPTSNATSDNQISLTVEFSGGLEMLFDDQRRYEVSVPAVAEDGKPATIAFLVGYLCQNLMKDSRKELFVLDDHIRPGILLLINDTDWELEGEELYELKNGDHILQTLLVAVSMPSASLVKSHSISGRTDASQSADLGRSPDVPAKFCLRQRRLVSREKNARGEAEKSNIYMGLLKSGMMGCSLECTSLYLPLTSRAPAA
ncbi:Urm1-domain-containing protein [Sodiomyces alkalinus F11]|uniref:Ubiquitin-related modifier 1 n=1 Tax=Sodiomyces alkalinus (strain CBS 110278 / VKM F-3762 / F11) TaxID=1314773 RepID=A0A3N2PXM8_SODAK|nr:Urm1-domain-containing protein [Sodiomyces alkalinus F11]ROT39176.1 Urm1-domain-containing protein [Sodiomyces alkalinus F11]